MLENGAAVAVIGEEDYASILTVQNLSDDREPRVAVIAQRLVGDFGLGIIPRVKEVYPDCVVLVDGEHESNETTASILAAGASGFFSLNAPPHYLARAVEVVADGKLWGPREAVALMAQHAMEQQPLVVGRDDLTPEDLSLLVGRLYRRFGVNTRLQLLTTAMKQGVIKSSH